MPTWPALHFAGARINPQAGARCPISDAATGPTMVEILDGTIYPRHSPKDREMRVHVVAYPKALRRIGTSPGLGAGRVRRWAAVPPALRPRRRERPASPEPYRYLVSEIAAELGCTIWDEAGWRTFRDPKQSGLSIRSGRSWTRRYFQNRISIVVPGAHKPGRRVSQ